MSTNAYDTLLLSFSSLTNYWKLDEANGASSVADSKGTNTGTPNATGVTLGQTGPLLDGGMLLDGTAGRVVFGSMTLSQTFTYLAWVNTTQNAKRAVYSNRIASPSQPQIECAYANPGGVPPGRPDVNVDFASEVTGVHAISDGRWHFVGWTNNGSFITTYVDACIDTCKAQSIGTGALSQTAYLGWDATDGYLLGSIARVAVCNAALTSGQISQLWATAQSINHALI